MAAALSYAVPVSTGEIGLQHSTRWWEQQDEIHGGTTNTNTDRSTVWYPSDALADAYAALPHPQREARARVVTVAHDGGVHPA